jgi:hypothetical protein
MWARSTSLEEETNLTKKNSTIVAYFWKLGVGS